MNNRRTMRMFIHTTAITLLLFSLLGCGVQLVPVAGRVTYDGEPLDQATVVFEPDGVIDGRILPFGGTDTEGNFSLATKNDKGALPGKYAVTITKNQLMESNDPSKGLYISKSLLPKIYADAKSTPLKVEVPPDGKTDFVFELSKDAGATK